jgi:hypothetical protein
MQSAPTRDYKRRRANPPRRHHITAPARYCADIRATPGSTVNTWAKHFMQLPGILTFLPPFPLRTSVGITAARNAVPPTGRGPIDRSIEPLGDRMSPLAEPLRSFHQRRSGLSELLRTAKAKLDEAPRSAFRIDSRRSHSRPPGLPGSARQSARSSRGRSGPTRPRRPR